MWSSSPASDSSRGDGGERTTNISITEKSISKKEEKASKAMEVPDEEIADITQQMGRLWWPTSNQDLAKTHGRDKHGRLIQVGNIGKDNNGSNGKECYSCRHESSTVPETFTPSNMHISGDDKEKETMEWYDTVIPTAHSVGSSSLAELRKSKADNGGYDGKDPKLQTSIALTKTLDKVWAKELYEMDAAEREDIANEIHGIFKNNPKNQALQQETPESVDEAIQSFRRHIETHIHEPLDNGDSIVPPVTKEAYTRARNELKSDYIVSKPFLIKFLRVCHYDTKQAELRYFRYLDLITLLFGDDALKRPLELTDLTKRELRYLKTGQMQLLPNRDRVGRRIYAFSGFDDRNFNIREKYRTNIYLIDVLSDDVPTQKLGTVSLNAPRVRTDTSHPFGFEGMTLRKGNQELLGGKHTETQFFRKINEAVPIRFSAIHYFAPSTIIYNIGRAIILTLLGKDHRKIVRFHAGSQIECDYSLKSFGIPHEDIPITDGHNIKTKNVQKFINARTSIESFRKAHPDTPDPGIECPGLNCIVFGDKVSSGGPANVEFRELLKAMEKEREEAFRNQHAMLPKQFIDHIIATATSPEHNLRFLAFDKSTSLFVDISDPHELHKRVSQALRDQRKRSRVGSSKASPRTPRPAAAASVSPTQTSASDDTSDHCALGENGGSSIMGFEAAKRLKRSSSSSDESCSFCTSELKTGAHGMHRRSMPNP